jgi:hypothetical protein
MDSRGTIVAIKRDIEIFTRRDYTFDLRSESTIISNFAHHGWSVTRFPRRDYYRPRVRLIIAVIFYCNRIRPRLAIVKILHFDRSQSSREFSTCKNATLERSKRWYFFTATVESVRDWKRQTNTAQGMRVNTINGANDAKRKGSLARKSSDLTFLAPPCIYTFIFNEKRQCRELIGSSRF